MLHRVLRVMSREYTAYVRTKTFLFSAIAFPMTLILAIGLPVLLEGLSKAPRAFTILDTTGRYQDAVLDGLFPEREAGNYVVTDAMRDLVYNTPEQLMLPEGTAAQEWTLEQLIHEGKLFAFFVIRADSSGVGPSVDYYTSDPGADVLSRRFRQILGQAVTMDRLLPYVPDEQYLRESLQGVSMITHAVIEGGSEEATAAHIARSYAPMAFVYLLWISVLMMSSHLMTSTIEEKNSRVIEVLLSSVSSFEFMLGKLLGLAGAGLTMIGVWAGTAILVIGAVPSQTFQQIGAGIGGAFGGITLLWFILFFLLGFLFYASIFVGLGSVCNTMREAQNLTQPFMFMLMIPLFLMVYVTNNPDHIVSVAASFFPPFIPFVIMNRIPATPPAPVWQILVAAGLLLVSTYWIVLGAAKVFRTGILMYGKAPTLPEILRWARRSSG
jgi:ABC-2 type transport system permease protein